MANEAAATALVKEKGRLMEEFRAQIRTEAIKTIQSTISASKEVIAHQAMKELSEAHEAGVRNNYAVWMKKMEHDMEGARQHMLSQVKEVSRRIEGLAASATERVQHNMETTRTEAVDRFVSRLREQVAPMLVEAKDSIQKLETSQTAFKKESQAIYAGLENQLEFSANESLAKAQEQLEKNTIAVAAKNQRNPAETLSKLRKGRAGQRGIAPRIRWQPDDQDSAGKSGGCFPRIFDRARRLYARTTLSRSANRSPRFRRKCRAARANNECASLRGYHRPSPERFIHFVRALSQRHRRQICRRQPHIAHARLIKARSVPPSKVFTF